MYMYLILGSRSSDSIFPKWQCTCGVLTYAGTSFCNFLRLYWLVLCFITSISKGWEPFSIRASLAHPLCVSIRVCSHSFSPSLPRRRAHSWASSSSRKPAFTIGAQSLLHSRAAEQQSSKPINPGPIFAQKPAEQRMPHPAFVKS